MQTVTLDLVMGRECDRGVWFDAPDADWPLVGAFLSWRGRTWRVLDVVPHGTPPLVRVVRAEDAEGIPVGWRTDLPPS